MARSVLLACARGVAGCSGGPLDGCVHGESLAIRSVLSASVVSSVGGMSQSVAEIVMTTTDYACADLSTYTARANERIVMFGLGDNNGTITTAPTAPGEYTVYVCSAFGSCNVLPKGAQLEVIEFD